MPVKGQAPPRFKAARSPVFRIDGLGCSVTPVRKGFAPVFPGAIRPGIQRKRIDDRLPQLPEGPPCAAVRNGRCGVRPARGIGGLLRRRARPDAGSRRRRCGGEKGSVEGRRFRRPRRRGGKGRHPRPGEGLSASGQIRRGPGRQGRRPVVRDRARSVQGGRRTGAGRAGARRGLENARRDPAAAGRGTADETGRHRGPARSGRGLRPAGRRRRAQRQGQSFHRQHQSRLRLHHFADQRPHRHDRCDRRQCRRPRQRRARDHREPGPDVCDFPGQPARFHAGDGRRQIQPQGRRRRRSASRTARTMPRPAGSISST